MAGQERRALRVVESARHPLQVACHRDHFLGESAAQHHAVADGNIRHVGRDFRHVAGRLHARHERQRRLVLVFSGDHQHVGIVQPGRAHGDAHLARGKRLALEFFEMQLLRFAQLAADDVPWHEGVLVVFLRLVMRRA